MSDAVLLFEKLTHVDRKLDRMIDMLHQILAKETHIMGVVDDALVQAEAAAKATEDQEDVIIGLLGTVTTLINSLKSSSTDPATAARITALAAALDAKSAALAAAGAATPTS